MNEEPSIEPTDSGDIEGESFDMQDGLDSLSSDLFGAESEPETDDGQELKLEEDKPDEKAKDDEPKVPERAAPQSWKKEMHEKYSALPPEVQDYIDQREEQMKGGLDINKEDSNLGRSVRDIMEPYKEILTKANVEPSYMIKSLMGAHYKLTTAEPAEKAQIMANLAHSYGVDLSDEQLKNHAQQINPEVESLKNELNSLKYKLNERDSEARQAEQSKITSRVNEFAEKHEYFDEVSDQIVTFIKAGDTLEDAYEKAVWANPITRQKELDRAEQEKVDAANKAKMEKVRAAKQAKSVNVESRETSKSPTGFLGSMEDTMRETLHEIQNRT